MTVLFADKSKKPERSRVWAQIGEQGRIDPRSRMRARRFSFAKTSAEACILRSGSEGVHRLQGGSEGEAIGRIDLVFRHCGHAGTVYIEEDAR